MKRSKDEEPSTFPYDPDFFTARDIRTVDLARVAALFLGPEDEDYANAALRALRLMHVCASVLNRNRRLWDAAKITDKRLAAAGAAGLDVTIPFKQAIKIITGERRKKRAEAAFLSYMETTMPDATKKQLVAEYSEAEQDGFTGRELLAVQSKFDALREEGRLAGKKRRRHPSRAKK